MYNISICIPTYKRPEMLRKLVLSISDCSFNKSLINRVNIIVADNDPGSTAKPTMSELKEKINTEIGIRYFNYPVRGLSNVRNELLKNAFSLNPDYIVFVDDDEYVTVEWLNELVKTIITNRGDMAMGPVVSKLNPDSSRYISCWLERQEYLNGTKLNFVRTGNLILSVKSLTERKIWFDPRFNETGGEDSFFGIQMIKCGASVYWAANAVVYETVPENRANIKWVLKRYYNGANVYTYILKVEKNYLKLIKRPLSVWSMFCWVYVHLS